MKELSWYQPEYPIGIFFEKFIRKKKLRGMKICKYLKKIINFALI